MTEPLAQRGPGEILRFLQDARDELARIDGELQSAHDDLADAEEAWTAHLDDVLATLEEDVAEGRRDRMPFKDQAIGIARRTGAGRDLWNAYRRADRMVRKWEASSTGTRGQIGAAQSEAKLMGIA